MQEAEDCIEGFYFEDEAVARQAMREYMYIGRMQDKVSALSPDGLKDFYHKLIDKRIFSTQVGLTYLYEIRSALIENYHFGDEELDQIVIPMVSKETPAPSVETMQSASEEIMALKRTKILLYATVGILVLVIVGFFVIIAANQNIGYINTENKILNKYSQWQEELDAREKALDEREEALNNGSGSKNSGKGSEENSEENNDVK